MVLSWQIAITGRVLHVLTMDADPPHANLSLRIKLGPDSFLGPGKVGLLKRIDRLGSISAAARDMGMSYRRAWLLIDSLNRVLSEPVLATEPGGKKGGGASLTPTGRRLLNLYLAIEERSSREASKDLRDLELLLSDRVGLHEAC